MTKREISIEIDKKNINSDSDFENPTKIESMCANRIFQNNNSKDIAYGLLLSTVQKNYFTRVVQRHFVYLEREIKKISFAYNVLTVTMNVGSIVLPTLLGVEQSSTNKSTIGGIAFITSFITSVATVLYSKYDVSKRFYKLQKCKARFEREINEYVTLTGKYENQNDHKTNFTKFAKICEILILQGKEIQMQARKENSDNSDSKN